MKRAGFLLATLLVVYLVICLLVYFLQDHLLFFPSGAPNLSPDHVGMAYRELDLVTADGVRLHGWWIPHPRARGAVLVAHGNAGNVEVRIPLARTLHEMEFAVLLFDYRGYGKSEGRPSEEGLYLDAEAAYDFVVGEADVPPGTVVLFGESLGAAVATELALRRPCGALILESAFTSIPDIASDVYPWLPVRWLTRFRFDTVGKLGRIGVPMLLIHSPHDEIVPFAHAERLLAAAGEEAELLKTAGGHNDGGFQGREVWREEVRRFLVR